MDQTLHMWLHRRTYKPSMPLFLPLLYKDELLLYTKRSYQFFFITLKINAFNHISILLRQLVFSVHFIQQNHIFHMAWYVLIDVAIL